MKLRDLAESSSDPVIDVAKKAATALANPCLFRGINNPENFADETFALKNGYVLHVAEGRILPRGSLTGNSLALDLTPQHPDWKKLNLPLRNKSTFCSTDPMSTSGFGALSLILPFNSVSRFGVMRGDFNLVKNSHSNVTIYSLMEDLAALLMRFHITFQRLERIIDDPDTILKLKKNFNIREVAEYKNLSESELLKRVKDLALRKVIVSSKINSTDFRKHWDMSKVEHLDALYDAIKEDNGKDRALLDAIIDEFGMWVDIDTTLMDLEKIAFKGSVSAGIMKALSPEALGIWAGSYSDIVKLPTRLEHEVWFEGPHLILQGSKHPHELIRTAREIL